MNRYIQEANQQFISAYNRYPIILDHGEGMYLYDIDGKRYLDFGSGIAFNSLKNNHYHLKEFTTARSVYIFFKIYIPAAVTVVRNGKQEQQRKLSWQN